MAQFAVQLHRHPGTPWGFRLQGGRDFSSQLSVKRVGFHCNLRKERESKRDRETEREERESRDREKRESRDKERRDREREEKR